MSSVISVNKIATLIYTMYIFFVFYFFSFISSLDLQKAANINFYLYLLYLFSFPASSCRNVLAKIFVCLHMRERSPLPVAYCKHIQNFLYFFSYIYSLLSPHFLVIARIFSLYNRSTFTCVALLVHQQCNQRTPVALAKAQWHHEAAAGRSKRITRSSTVVVVNPLAAPSRYAMCCLQIYVFFVLLLPLFRRLFYFDPFFYCFCKCCALVFSCGSCSNKSFAYCYALYECFSQVFLSFLFLFLFVFLFYFYYIYFSYNCLFIFHIQQLFKSDRSIALFINALVCHFMLSCLHPPKCWVKWYFRLVFSFYYFRFFACFCCFSFPLMHFALISLLWAPATITHTCLTLMFYCCIHFY